jgi:hypothetical protein
MLCSCGFLSKLIEMRCLGEAHNKHTNWIPIAIAKYRIQDVILIVIRQRTFLGHTLTLHNIQLKNTSFTRSTTPIHNHNAHVVLSIGQRESNLSTCVHKSDG